MGIEDIDQNFQASKDGTVAERMRKLNAEMIHSGLISAADALEIQGNRAKETVAEAVDPEISRRKTKEALQNARDALSRIAQSEK